MPAVEPMEVNDTRSNWRWLREWGFAQSASVLGLVYVLGFVVANAHYARFGPVTWGALETRYLGAGLLFTSFAAPLILVGWSLDAHRPLQRAFQAIRHPGRRKALGASVGRRTGASALIWAYIVVVPPTVFLATLMNAPTAQVVLPEWTVPLGGLIPLVLYLLSFGYMGRVVWREGRKRRARVFLLALSFFIVPAMMLLTAALFGSSVYPYVQPAFGGGRAWEVSIQSDMFDFAGTDILVDIDEIAATLLICDPAADNPLSVSSIPRESLGRVEYLRSVALPSRSSQLEELVCGT